jgi:hypothetical protein
VFQVGKHSVVVEEILAEGESRWEIAQNWFAPIFHTWFFFLINNRRD